MRNRDLKSIFLSVLQLGKFTISIPVALTGFLGYFRVSGKFDWALVFVIFGILLMSMGSSTFNQILERKTDNLMKRTKKRPLPSGRVSLKFAIISGITLSLAGFILLLLTKSILAASIGLFTLLWYTLVYTPLKKLTPYAVLPGAIIGALPPLIGWAAAGGNILDTEIIMISMFLFIGQMPHYWLLLMKVGDEFKDAGLPVITAQFSKIQLRNISFSWIFAAALAVAIFPVFQIIHSSWLTYLLLAVIAIFLVMMFILSFRGEIMEHWKRAFMTVNLFYLFIILLLVADKLIEPYLYSH